MSNNYAKHSGTCNVGKIQGLRAFEVFLKFYFP